MITNQTSFALIEHQGKKKVTRSERFLCEMESIVPFARMEATIEPFYPKGERGRPPVGLSRMLRMYLVQQWFGLADEAVEDALYDNTPMRLFVGIDLSRESVPDATTLLLFRRLLETHHLTQAVFAEINAGLTQKGLLLKGGSMVDATLIAAPSSTKNADHARDPEMHQTKKGNQWYHGMKAHIGADTESGLVHTLVTTAANASDIGSMAECLREDDATVHLDAGYVGAQKREEIIERQADGRLKADIDWQIAKRRKGIRAMAEGPMKDLLLAAEKAKAQVRAFVEHPFHIVKNLFNYRGARYRGLAKNTAQLYMLFGLANLMIAKKALMLRAGDQSVLSA